MEGNTRCHFCGREDFEQRRISYLYRYKDQSLLVPNTPVEVCLNCGMYYYQANVLLEIERYFFTLRDHAAEPKRYVNVPERDYAAISA